MGVKQAVLELLKTFPDAPARTLAKRLHDDNPALFPTIERARTAVRYALGQHGRKNRSMAKLPRPARKAGELPPLPDFEVESWEPFAIDARRNLVFSDPHIPFTSRVALEAMLGFADTYNPDAIFVNGDWADFYQLSRFDKHPSISKVEHELAVSKQLWTHLRQRYPRARLFYKLGNHDERWAKYIYSAAPLLAGVEQVVEGWRAPMGIIENRVTVIDKKRPVMLGKLPVLHGHELGSGASSPVSPARGAFLKTLHTVMVSHWHRTSGTDQSNMFNDETYCWSIGCLCGLHPYYRPVNQWNWGFAAVSVKRDGEFDVQNMRINKHGTVRTA